MAKFIYRMQNVLNIKERLETQAKTEYAQMMSRLSYEEQVMREIISRLRAYENTAKELSQGKLDIVSMRRCSDSIKVTKDQINQQAIRVRIAEKNVAIAQKKFNAAMQERKIHDKLKEQAFEEFKADLAAQEMKEIDEVVSFNYNDRETGE